MALTITSQRPALARKKRSYGLLLTGAVMVLAAALLPPALSMALLGAIGLGALLLAYPGAGVYLLVVAVPYESLHEVQVGGLNATVVEFIAFCAGAAFLMRCAMEGRMRLQWAWWRWPVLLYALVMIISMTQAIDVKLSIKELLKLGEMLLTYLLVLTYIDTPAKLRRLFLLVVIVALSQACYGIIQTGAHFGPASFARGAVLRASGTFDQPNPFAGYLNFTLPLVLAAVIANVPLAGALTRPAVVILGAGVLLSVSRGAMLATLAALAVMILIQMRSTRPLLAAGAVALFAIFAGAIFGIVPDSIVNGVKSAFGVADVDVVNPTPVTWPVAERLAHMLAGLRMFADHPILGVGIGNYPAAYPRYQVAPVWTAPLGHAHNYYINVAAEAGIIGLIAFLVMLISAFVIVAHLYRHAATAEARALTLGALGVLITVAVHSNFDSIFVHAMEAQLALVIGMATVSCRMSLAGEVTGGNKVHV